MRSRRTQAFRQAPWRLQVRWTGKTMLSVIVFVLVAGLYLAVNAKVALAGRQVLTLEARRAELQRVNAEMSATLASLTAPDQMLAKASALGFRPAGPKDVAFVTVDGYQPPPAFVAPRPPAALEGGASMLSPAYTETLGEWLTRWWAGDGGRR